MTSFSPDEAPDLEPQVVHWQPTRASYGAGWSLGGLSGEVVFGLALVTGAVGMLAIGALAVGALAIGQARIGRLEIDELVVRRRG